MKIPRDISSSKLIKGLQKNGYSVTRQTGSHIRLQLNKWRTSYNHSKP